MGLVISAHDVNSIGNRKDPLLCREPLGLERAYWPLGFPVRVETNSPLVLEAADISWGECAKRFDVEPVVVRAGVHGPDDAPVPEAPVYRSHDYLLSIVASRFDTAVCDLQHGFASCWVTPAFVADSSYFRYTFLEAMTYMLLAGRYLAPVHAAAVEFKGSGVLLCGDSGSGKSTLAFASAQRGWTYVCDDGAHLVRDQQDPLVVGASFEIRLREDAKRLFPDVAMHLPRRRASGSIKLEIRTADLPWFRTANEVTVRHILFLDRRRSGPAEFAPMTDDEALAQFMRVTQYGADAMHREWERSYRRLLSSSRVARLSYSDLDSAIDRLEQKIREDKG
ncbi:MAG: hypothetical protein ABI823_03800 [Bryobacteraceae bacterium]